MPALINDRDISSRSKSRTLFGSFVVTVLGSLLVAALLTLPSQSAQDFWPNLLYSECIGLAVLAWCVLFGRIPLFDRIEPRRRLVLIILAGMPFGFISGFTVANLILHPATAAISLDHPAIVGGALATLLATGFIGYFVWMRGRIATEAAARSEAQRLAAESQLRLLRAQLEPHMLFNTLANLRALIDEDPKLAQAMIDQLNVYLRGALAASRSESTALAQEFELLKAYLEIMALRMGARLSFRLELPVELRQAVVPPMLLQPLIENAIKHGLEPKVEGGSIEVAARATPGGVTVTVTDSGIGLPDDPLSAQRRHRGSNYGLEHVRERLAASYGKRASLTIERHQPQGVRATVTIPSS